MDWVAKLNSIDYTAGGKIAGFLSDMGEEKRCFDFQKIKLLTSDMIKELVEDAMKSVSKVE